MNLKAKTHYLLVVLLVGIAEKATAQQPVENSVFWEISGNGLKKPSYLFGTFHLMGNLYVDSLTNVMNKFGQSEAVVGELVIDSTMTMKVMMAAQLKGTSLSQLLSEDTYAKTSAWLKELANYDLKMFNTLNPITVQIFLMAMLQTKYYPMDPAKDVPMDMYFQKLGTKNGKKVIGLESMDEQIFALYDQFSYKRQAELLQEYVQDKDKAYQEMVSMNRFYRQQNLKELESLMSTQTYNEGEASIMLDNRNKKWLEQLPSIIRLNSTFIAVGALHLAGKNGLINLLREKGFTVKPINLKG